MDLEVINSVVSAITSPQIQQMLLPMKVTFIIFTVFFAGGIIFYLTKTDLLNEVIIRDFVRFFLGQSYGLKKFERDWEKVKKRVEAGTESEWKLAVMEADDMLDDILKNMGLSGSNINERLARAQKGVISDVEGAQKAHQVRDNVVHDPDYRLSREEARDALKIFEKALKDLEVFA